MRKSGVAEKYGKVVNMYEESETAVRCAAVMIEGFQEEVGLHQGSTLSPFLFAMVVDRLTDEIIRGFPWTMMFVNDFVLCGESREEVEEELERWRYALERKGMEVSRSKTDYVCSNERDSLETVRWRRSMKSTTWGQPYNGDCDREVKRRVQAGWTG